MLWCRDVEQVVGQADVLDAPGMSFPPGGMSELLYGMLCRGIPPFCLDYGGDRRGGR